MLHAMKEIDEIEIRKYRFVIKCKNVLEREREGRGERIMVKIPPWRGLLKKKFSKLGRA